jgi:hypothetical protein
VCCGPFQRGPDKSAYRNLAQVHNHVMLGNQNYDFGAR